LTTREQSALDYNEKLKKRFSEAPEIKRISKHRHLPKPVYKAKQLKHLMKTSARRKFQNKLSHSKPGSIKRKEEREKHIVEQME
jgi:WD repeat and SOF domain-containing protein 1